MDGSVQADIVVRTVRQSGSDAEYDGQALVIRPKNGAPVVYEINGEPVKRRIVIEIAKRTEVSPHLFWNSPHLLT